MSEKKYSGWSNPETWCVNLWLTRNDDTCFDAQATESVGQLEQFTREDVDLEMNETPSLTQDLAVQALKRVNWKEIFASLHDR